MGFLTNDLEAAVFVKLSNVSGAEPPLLVLIYKVVLLAFCLPVVVTHGHVGSSDENLSSWMRLVSASITTLETIKSEIKNSWKTILLIVSKTVFVFLLGNKLNLISIRIEMTTIKVKYDH